MLDAWTTIEFLVFGLTLLLAHRHFRRQRIRREVAVLRKRAGQGDYGFSGVKPGMLDVPRTDREWKDAEKEEMGW